MSLLDRISPFVAAVGADIKALTLRMDSIPSGFTPPVLSIQQPCIGSGTATAAFISGQISFVPFDIGPKPLKTNRLGLTVVAAQAGGVTQCVIGLYRDNGTGGYPDIPAGPLASGPLILTAVGNTWTDFTEITIPRGRAWLSVFYLATTAPTTIPTTYYMGTTGQQLWTPPNLLIGGQTSRGLIKTGLAAVPTTDPVLSISGGNQVVLGGIRRSA